MIHTQPSDTGFGCVSRRRAFSIFVHREDGCFIDDPQILYDRLCEKLRCKQLQIPSLVWADEAAVQSEMLAVAKGTGRSEGGVWHVCQTTCHVQFVVCCNMSLAVDPSAALPIQICA